MPTATAKPTRSTRKGAKAGSRKVGARRTTKATSASGARKETRKTSPSKAKRTKAARARAASQTRAAVRQAETATRFSAFERPNAFGDYAERAVLIPVGVALTARDRVI